MMAWSFRPLQGAPAQVHGVRDILSGSGNTTGVALPGHTLLFDKSMVVSGTSMLEISPMQERYFYEMHLHLIRSEKRKKCSLLLLPRMFLRRLHPIFFGGDNDVIARSPSSSI